MKAEKIRELKRQAINNAKRTGDIHYVVSGIKPRQFIPKPIHCDTVIDWGEFQIEYIAFSHTSFIKTVPTQETKHRFDLEISRYSKYMKKKDRKPNLTWTKFNMENPQ